MSRAKTVSLAVVILITSAFLVAAHNTPNHPAITGEREPQSKARLTQAPSTVAASAASTDIVAAPPAVLPMTENAYDFNNIDGIPGFGTLPPAYDSRPVMPQIGSP